MWQVGQLSAQLQGIRFEPAQSQLSKYLILFIQAFGILKFCECFGVFNL